MQNINKTPNVIDAQDLRERFIKVMRIKCYSIRQCSEAIKVNPLTVTHFLNGLHVQMKTLLKIASFVDNCEQEWDD